jgi:hypothetical protein
LVHIPNVRNGFCSRCARWEYEQILDELVVICVLLGVFQPVHPACAQLTGRVDTCLSKICSYSQHAQRLQRWPSVLGI